MLKLSQELDLHPAVQSHASKRWPRKEETDRWEEEAGRNSSLLELLAPIWLGTLHSLWNASEWMWLKGADCSSGLGEGREGAESGGSWEGVHFDGCWEWWLLEDRQVTIELSGLAKYKVLSEVCIELKS